MIDLGVRNRWTVSEAVARIRAFEDRGLHWIEEPLGADDPDGYATLRAKTTTLIAYGEREWTVAGIRRIVNTGTVDVVGIDPGRAEGITGFHRGCLILEEARRQANAHAWAGPVTFAAALAVSMTSPACHQMEVQPLANPLHRDLAVTPRPVQGRMWPLTGPGLGIEVDETAIEHYRLDA